MAIPIIPILIAAAAAASAGTSAAAAGEADAAENQIQSRKDAEMRRYNHEKNTNFLDTDSARATLATLRRQNKKNTEIANTDAVKHGMSDEARMAMASKLNENYGEQVTKLSGFGTQYKQQMEDNHFRRLDSLDNALYNSQLGKASALSGLSGSISGLLGAVGGMYDSGAFSKTSNTKGGIAKGQSFKTPPLAIPYGQSIPLSL